MNARRRFFRFIVRRRAGVLVAVGALVLLTGFGASRVKVDYGVEQLLPAWGEERRTYDQYKVAFPREDLRFSLFWEDRRLIDGEVLQDLSRAVDAFQSVGLTDVQWIGDLRDPASGRRLSELDDPDVAVVGAVLAHHRDNPLFAGVLWNPDQDVFVVHGYLSPEKNTDSGRREVERALTSELDSLGVSEATWVLSGVPVLRSRIPILLERDQGLFLGGGAILFFGLLFFFLRRPGQVVACLASVVPGYLATVGLMAALGRPISILTSFIPIVVLVVGVSDAIHLVVAWRSRRLQGADGEAAVVESFAELAPACFYTSLTTAVGFACLAGTGIGLVIEFGLFTAFAIVLTFVFAMTVLPALLSFSRAPVQSLGQLDGRWMRGLLDRVATAAGHPGPGRLAVFGTIAVVAIALGSTLRVDTYLVDDLKETSPVMRDLRWIEDEGFGLFQINVFVRGEALTQHSAAMLAWMADLEDFGRADPLVQSALGLPDFAARLGPETDWKTVAVTLDAVVSSDRNALADVYLPDEGIAQVVFTVKDAGSAATLPFLEKLDGWLTAHPPPSGEASGTGLVHLFQGYTSRILSSFGPSLGLAMLLILGVMSFMFRSLRLGLLAMIPNLFPLVVLAGVMAVGGIALKPSTILVFSIVFAIAVDDTIHMLGHIRRGLAEGVPVADALRAGVRGAGPPILVTTLVVSAGFGLLMLSSFQVLFLVGFMTLTSAVAAVAADLLLFPAVLNLGHALRSRPIGLANVQPDTSPRDQVTHHV